jgi:hypothetical protein
MGVSISAEELIFKTGCFYKFVPSAEGYNPVTGMTLQASSELGSVRNSVKALHNHIANFTYPGHFPSLTFSKRKPFRDQS